MLLIYPPVAKPCEPPAGLLEDVDFLKRLRSYGRFVLLPDSVITSARRFQRFGPVRQQLRNILIVSLFEVGVPVRFLTRLYPPVR